MHLHKLHGTKYLGTWLQTDWLALSTSINDPRCPCPSPLYVLLLQHAHVLGQRGIQVLHDEVALVLGHHLEPCPQVLLAVLELTPLPR